MRAVAAVLAALLLTACPPPDGLVYSTSSPYAAQQVRERLQPVLDKHGFMGELRVSGGALDGAKSGRGRIMPWASVTKQIVATMVMQQVEAGALALDEPVDSYLADWPRDGLAAPTLRHLLRHQSGLHDPEDAGETTPPSDPAVCIRERTTPPGGAFAYNNCDYLVVARILEQVTSQEIAELFANRIAEPSGMMLAGFVGPDTVLAGTRDAANRERISRYGAAGALAGPASDLILFDEALMQGKLIGTKERDEMWRGEPTLGYTALGQWESVLPLEGCREPVRIIERRGSIGAFEARNFILPEQQIAIAIMVEQTKQDLDFGEPWTKSGFSYDVLSVVACSE